MTNRRRYLGQAGEALVAGRLRAAGWHVRETNWRCQDGEIDIVALDGLDLVIVEVRTRGRATMGLPEESIGPRKRARLARLAQRYVFETGWEGPCRVDVFTVRLWPDRARPPEVTHYRNAVSGEWA
jgi:putative endonuclease